MTIKCGQHLLDLSGGVVMGVLNATPDSFYDGGRFPDSSAQHDQVGQMLQDGAAIIDIGGVSSRPGAADVSAQEELDRVLPSLEVLAKAFPEAIFSVDTFRAAVARQSVAAGASIINDITAGHGDANMLATVAELGVPYVVMHMQGTPKTMQADPRYDDVVADVYRALYNVQARCRDAMIHDVLIDPGFGFGKTVAHNYHLLDRLGEFQALERPILVGLSRKSMIYKPLGIQADQALNGTTALHMLALDRGAHVLRVHDVAPAQQAIRLHQELRAARKSFA